MTAVTDTWNKWISVFCELGLGFSPSSLCSCSCSFPWPLVPFSSPGFCSSHLLFCSSFRLRGFWSSQCLHCDAGPCPSPPCLPRCSCICPRWFWSCWLSPCPCCSASSSLYLPLVWSHLRGCGVDSSPSPSVCNLWTLRQPSSVTCSCERRPRDSWLAARSWSCYPDMSLFPSSSSFSFGSWPCCGLLNQSRSQRCCCCCCCWRSQWNCRCFQPFSCVFFWFFASVFCSSFSWPSAFLSDPVFWNRKVNIKTPGLDSRKWDIGVYGQAEQLIKGFITFKDNSIKYPPEQLLFLLGC